MADHPRSGTFLGSHLVDLGDLYSNAEKVRKREVAKALKFMENRPAKIVIDDISKSIVKKLGYHHRQLKILKKGRP